MASAAMPRRPSAEFTRRRPVEVSPSGRSSAWWELFCMLDGGREPSEDLSRKVNGYRQDRWASSIA